jgi:tetratricopeptide (TPR) repeat protein
MPHPKKAKTETITPVPFSRKDREAKRTRRGRGVFTFRVLAGLVLLLVAGGAWLVNYLEKRAVDTGVVEEASGGSADQGRETPETRNASQESEAEAPSVEISSTQPPEALDPAEVALQRQRAEEQLADFTLARKDLEQKGASEWGGNLYADMMRISGEADASLIDEEYVTALEKYSLATARANELADQMGDVFLQLMEKGRVALEEGDGETARQGFRLALMIDPANESAQHGLERAEKVEAVTELIETGKQHEENGNVSFAHADYQEAFRLDPESEEARKGLNRVKSQIKNEEFQRLISEGLAAFHHNELQLARKKLLKAKSFKPESREVKDALAEVDQGIRLAGITELRKKAMTAEGMENWKEALASYLAALEIDKNVQFAVQGKERVLKQIQIDKRVSFFLRDPDVLNADPQLEHALSLVHDIEKMESKGPRRAAELKELRRLVTAAQTPVKLIIESDNVTEVAIYKVGKLGRFNVRELDLRPGTYTVVGARDGYKDVRQSVVIKSGQNELRISVKCEARI